LQFTFKPQKTPEQLLDDWEEKEAERIDRLKNMEWWEREFT